MAAARKHRVTSDNLSVSQNNASVYSREKIDRRQPYRAKQLQAGIIAVQLIEKKKKKGCCSSSLEKITNLKFICESTHGDLHVRPRETNEGL